MPELQLTKRESVYPDFDNNQWIIRGDVKEPNEECLKDWTDVEDPKMAQWLVEKRHLMARVLLQQGRPIQLTSSKASLFPLLRSGETFPLHPLLKKDVLVGDIVFAAVEPGGRHYIALVWAKENTPTGTVYHLGNHRYGAAARWNGWCYNSQIYGYLPLEHIHG